MALHPCKECKKELSTDAKFCPHCGKKVGMSTAKGCLVVFLVLIGIGVVMSGLDRSDTSGVSTPTASPASSLRDRHTTDSQQNERELTNCADKNPALALALSTAS